MLAEFLPQHVVDSNKFRFYELSNVEMDPARHIIYYANGYDDTMAWRLQGLSYSKYSGAKKQNLKIPRDEVKLIEINDALCIPTHRNFYHLTVDCLPRLCGAFERPSRVLACGNLLNKLPQVFDAVRDWVPVEEWVLIDVDERVNEAGLITRENRWRVVGDRLSFYSSSHPSLNHAFVHNKFLAAAFWKRWYKEHFAVQKQTRKVFLARTVKDASVGERCMNQRELFDSLPGFEWIDPYDHSFVDMARIMNSAEVVVGVHGAGLANLLFCQPRTKIIQLANKSGSDVIYQRVAEMMQLEHNVVYGTDPVTNELVHGNKRESWRIDPAQVLTILNQL